jgi:hypothetical protein
MKARQGKQQGVSNKVVKTVGCENESNKAQVARCNVRTTRHSSKCSKAHQQSATTRTTRHEQQGKTTNQKQQQKHC